MYSSMAAAELLHAVEDCIILYVYTYLPGHVGRYIAPWAYYTFTITFASTTDMSVLLVLRAPVLSRGLSLSEGCRSGQIASPPVVPSLFPYMRLGIISESCPCFRCRF